MKLAHMIVLVLGVIGVGFQFFTEESLSDVVDGSTNFAKGLDFYSQRKQYLYSVLSAIFYANSQVLLEKTRPYVHHSIDSIYVSLAMTLVMPSFVLSDYSMYPAKMTIDSNEMLYYFVSGICTFFFHSQLTHLMCLPNKSKQYLCFYAIVLASLIAIGIDQAVFSHSLRSIQVIGICLLVIPGVILDLLQFR